MPRVRMRLIKNLIKRILRGMSDQTLTRLSEFFFALNNKIDDQIRWVMANRQQIPEIRSFDGAEKLTCSIIEDHPPWENLSPDHGSMPGMISPEECQYYKYMGRFYSGKGALVELGPWLGRSTKCILQGLMSNPNFQGKKLFVFDDFIWRAEWMNKSVPASQQLKDGQDFQPLFESYVAERENLIVQKRKISFSTENTDIKPLEWTEGPVEMMFIDCGRTFEGNEAWFSTFQNFFIPNTTLLVLQDWGTHKEIPVKWYNQMKQFVGSKAGRLQPIHELKWGSTATFLFRG